MKYNWIELKKEFLESTDQLSVKGFFSDKNMLYNSYIAKKTKGRHEEKKSIFNNVKSRLINEAEDVCYKTYKPNMERWNKLHSDFTKHIETVFSSLDATKPNALLLSTLWKIINTERQILQDEYRGVTSKDVDNVRKKLEEIKLRKSGIRIQQEMDRRKLRN